jgi:hypothetical protein
MEGALTKLSNEHPALTWAALPLVTFLKAGHCYTPDSCETLHSILKHIRFLADTQLTD